MVPKARLSFHYARSLIKKIYPDAFHQSTYLDASNILRRYFPSNIKYWHNDNDDDDDERKLRKLMLAITETYLSC